VKKDETNNLLVAPQTASKALKKKVLAIMQAEHKEQIKKSRLLKIIET
jgi:hypothetical protein